MVRSDSSESVFFCVCVCVNLVLAILLLFFDFRVRLREHFRLFIVLAAYHEKITKQNKTKELHAKRIKNKTEMPTLDEQGW